MKKLVSLIIITLMIFSSITPAFSAGDDTQEGIVNYIKTIARLSAKQSIESYGLKASADCMQSGIFTALFEGEALTKETEIAIEGADFKRAKYLEFYLYTPEATDTSLAVALYSDSDSTNERDYYYTELKADFSGWEFFSVAFDDFKTSGKPNGFENVKSVSIIPGHNGTKVDKNARLYFDDIVIRAVPTNRNQIDGTTKEPSPVVLLDGKSGANGGLRPVTFDGVKCLKWAGTEDLHTPAIIPIPENIDLNDYGEIVFRIYPEKANLSYINLYFDADDPAVSTKDLYYGGFTSTWQGEWRDISMKLRTDILGDISKSKSPVGGLDTVTQLRLDAVGGGSEFHPDTVYYIESITLRGTHEPQPQIVGEYILDDECDESMTDYVSLIKENHPNKAHPRLIITDELIARIREYKDTDEFLKLAYDNVFRLANAYVETPPLDSLKDSGVLGDTVRVSTDIKDIALNCGLAYLLTGDLKYTDRIWQEIEVMTGTTQKWSSVNMLDTGVAATGFAIAYDWCYDVWTDEQKFIMRNTLMRNLFEGALLQLRRGFGSWLSQPGNWNEVIANGVVCASLAIGDEPGYEALMNEAINRTVHYLPIKGLYGFAPDGAYGEGGAYWNLALETFFFMTNSMKTSMGTDAGLEDFPGLAETGYFPFGIRGPMGAFNHSDSSKTMFEGGTPVYLYIGYRYNIPSLISNRVNYIDESLEPTDLLWYNPTKPVAVDYRDGLPLDYMASGVEPQGSFRSGYNPDAYFIAFKGGNNGAGHDQSDIGSFVIDALGVRWIEDTGTETYFYTGDRNQYYRMRAEGNNCIQVNPKNGDLFEQTEAYNKYHTVCDYVDSASTDASAYAIFDMAPAYTEKLDSVNRGFALINNRTQFVIRDEFTAPEKSEIYAYYHTSKEFDITVSDDGLSALIKAPDGKKCAVNLMTDMPNVKLGVMNAVHHPSSPQPGAEDAVGNDNRIFQKIFIHADGVTEGSWSIVFTPLLADTDEVTLPENLSLSDWSKILSTTPQLTSISIDGIPLADFSSNIGTYIFDADKVSEVQATAQDGIDISITQAKSLGDAAYIKATSSSTGKSFTYRVKFAENLRPALASGAKVVSVSASHIPEVANPPEHAIDGNVNNRFAADGEPWLLCDLGEVKYIDAVSMAFFNGHTRKNVFNLEVSEDGEHFIKVFDGTSPGTTDKLYRYDFAKPIWARYVRFNGFGCVDINGNFVNTWNSIAEMTIHEIHTDFADTSSHWAKDDILFMRTYGLVNGVGDNLFSPENPVTVAEFLTMACRVAEFTQAIYGGEFSDVSESDWFAPYVATALKNGIIPSEMIEGGKLHPNANLTRAQMCAISALAYSAITFKVPENLNLTHKFTDIPDDAYKPYIDQAIGLRLTNGMSDTTFEPSSDITRAQSATILKRLFVIGYNVNR